MGSVLEITVVSNDRAVADQALASAFADVDRLEQVMSNWRPDTELSRFNARAGRGWVPVSADLGFVLRASRQLYEETRQAFDVTLGPVILLGRFDKVDPDGAALRAARSLVNGRELWATATHARLGRPGMAADLGGIGKGYALDLLVPGLRSAGIKEGFADFGRSSLVGFGPRRWSVQLRGVNGRPAGTVVLGDRSLSTSEAGRPEDTVLDARTGRVVCQRRQAVVRAVEGWRAEGWSTALVALGRELLGHVPRGLWVRYEDDQGVVVVGRDD